MIKWRLIVAGFLFVVAALVYALAVNFPDPQIQIQGLEKVTPGSGTRVEAQIDQGASALGSKVVPLEVLEDSRCPVDVVCIQAGTVRVRAEVQSTLGTKEETFMLGKAVAVGSANITLVSVSPEAHSHVQIAPSDYHFVFKVEKR